MKFIQREDWGAPASSPAAYIASTRGVKVHYLGTAYSSRAHSRCDDYVRSVRASHLANAREGYVDIAYNLVVCEHGTVYEGRGAHKKTGANGNAELNEEHYAVLALLGSSGLTKPSDAQLHGLRDGIEYLRDDGKAGSQILGHRDGYATACPGGPLYAWVQDGAPRPGAKPPSSSVSTYTVRKGDTLTSIAEAHGTTWQVLAALNDLPDPDKIRTGQKLKILGKTAPAPAPSRPVVDLSRLVAAARSDPPRAGTPISYYGAKTVETALVNEGLLNRRYADGHFGTATVSAYAAWQRRCGYTGRDADGIPGKTSLTALGSEHGFTVKD